MTLPVVSAPAVAGEPCPRCCIGRRRGMRGRDGRARKPRAPSRTTERLREKRMRIWFQLMASEHRSPGFISAVQGS